MGLPLLAPPKNVAEVCLNQHLFKIQSQFVFVNFVHPFFALLRVVVTAADMCRRAVTKTGNPQSRPAVRIRYDMVGDVESIDSLTPVAINETAKQEAFALIVAQHAT
jgi:hypothetical protein